MLQIRTVRPGNAWIGNVLLLLVIALPTAANNELPRVPTVAPPGPQSVTTRRLAHGALILQLRDNSESPETLSGLQSLFHVQDAPNFDAFDPDTAGASAGLNFEHIISGHQTPRNRFTPRRGRYRLFDSADDRAATLVRRREDSPWDVSSTLRFSIVVPNAVDFHFRCTPHDETRFGKQRHAIFFFADYMNDVQSPSIHFCGIEGADGEEKWVEVDAPPGHADWNKGGTYGPVGGTPTDCDSDHNFKLNSWTYDYPRFTKPFYFGRAARDMVFLLMFDRGHTSIDEMRFSLFKFKLPDRPRPAWDFQYVIHQVRENREYGFRGRLVWKKWVSADDCLDEYERWAQELGASEGDD